MYPHKQPTFFADHLKIRIKSMMPTWNHGMKLYLYSPVVSSAWYCVYIQEYFRSLWCRLWIFHLLENIQIFLENVIHVFFFLLQMSIKTVWITNILLFTAWTVFYFPLRHKLTYSLILWLLSSRFLFEVHQRKIGIKQSTEFIPEHLHGELK